MTLIGQPPFKITNAFLLMLECARYCSTQQAGRSEGEGRRDSRISGWQEESANREEHCKAHRNRSNAQDVSGSHRILLSSYSHAA